MNNIILPLKITIISDGCKKSIWIGKNNIQWEEIFLVGIYRWTSCSARHGLLIGG
jgi:hypothetical protein